MERKGTAGNDDAPSIFLTNESVTDGSCKERQSYLFFFESGNENWKMLPVALENSQLMSSLSSRKKGADNSNGNRSRDEYPQRQKRGTTSVQVCTTRGAVFLNYYLAQNKSPPCFLKLWANYS